MCFCLLSCPISLYHITVGCGLQDQRQELGLGRRPVFTQPKAKVPQSKGSVGEDEWHWLADTVPISGVSVVDLEQGGASGVPGPVLLFRQHSGLSWASTAQCAQEYPPQHGETVSMGTSPSPILPHSLLR